MAIPASVPSNPASQSLAGMATWRLRWGPTHPTQPTHTAMPRTNSSEKMYRKENGHVWETGRRSVHAGCGPKVWAWCHSTQHHQGTPSPQTAMPHTNSNSTMHRKENGHVWGTGRRSMHAGHCFQVVHDGMGLMGTQHYQGTPSPQTIMPRRNSSIRMY